jgi:hypothetical protein
MPEKEQVALDIFTREAVLAIIEKFRRQEMFLRNLDDKVNMIEKRLNAISVPGSSKTQPMDVLLIERLKNSGYIPLRIAAPKGGIKKKFALRSSRSDLLTFTTELSELLGGHCVITTSSDVQGIPALDLIIRQLGSTEFPKAMLKKVQASLVNGESVGFYPEAVQMIPSMAGLENLYFCIH